MYTRENKTSTNNVNLSNYIEGFDIFNSKLLYKLRDPKVNKVGYTITKYPCRPDLIALDYYGSTDYSDYVVLAAGDKGMNAFSLGNTIELISKTDLDNILNNM